MKIILVTGGAGFLGSNLCRYLLAQNTEDKIICLDNFYTGCKSNIKDLLENKRFKLIEHDIINPLPTDLYADEIYNLACPASPPCYQRDPVYTSKTNVWGILNVLEFAKKCNAKILQASTSEIYGDPKVHPQVESYYGNVNTIGIRACYDEGKRCAESIMFDYYRQYNVKIKVVRIFNTYGPYMAEDDGRVVSNFIIQALKNQDITIYGSGKQTRSLCYVDDLVRGLTAMMASKDDFVGPVNLGNPEEQSIIDIAKLICQITKSKSKFIYKELPKDDPTQRRPDNSLAKEKLNWQPQISAMLGLQKTVDYFSKLI